MTSLGVGSWNRYEDCSSSAIQSQRNACSFNLRSPSVYVVNMTKFHYSNANLWAFPATPLFSKELDTGCIASWLFWLLRSYWAGLHAFWDSFFFPFSALLIYHAIGSHRFALLIIPTLSFRVSQCLYQVDGMSSKVESNSLDAAADSPCWCIADCHGHGSRK